MHVNTFIGLCIGKYHLKKEGLLKTVKNLFIAILFSALHIKRNA